MNLKRTHGDCPECPMPFQESPKSTEQQEKEDMEKLVHALHSLYAKFVLYLAVSDKEAPSIEQANEAYDDAVPFVAQIKAIRCQCQPQARQEKIATFHVNAPLH